MFFNEGTDDFFVDFDGTRETNRSTCKPLDTGAESQIVTLDTLREDLAGQVYILRHFSGVATPVVAGYHTDIKRGEQSQQFTAGFIGSGAKRVGQHTACFGIVRVPEPVLLRLATNETPLLIEFTDERHVSMGNRR